MDALFGMPVLRSQPGELRLTLEGTEDERFLEPRAENCYQLWLRGANHASTSVRRALEDIESRLPAQVSVECIRQALVAEGLCAEPPRG